MPKLTGAVILRRHPSSTRASAPSGDGPAADGGVDAAPAASIAPRLAKRPTSIVAAGKMKAARSGDTATLLPSGKVLDVWHDGTISKGPALQEVRANATTTVLADGSVLVVGGFDVKESATAERLMP